VSAYEKDPCYRFLTFRFAVRAGLDMRKAGGDVMALLEAKAHQYVLTVTGLNTCILQVGAEGVKYLELK
jgi:hypothetical protein